MLRLALAQINTIVGDLDGNCQKILASVEQAKAAGADIVVFPELAITGYPPEDLLHKDYFVKDNIKALRSLAKKVKGIIAVVGFVDQDKDKKIYNAAAVIAGGTIRGIYHKQQLPNYGVFDEKRYFTEGTAVPLFVYNGVKFGVNICEDIWCDSAVNYVHKIAGVELIINLSSSPFDYQKMERRERILVDRAKQSKAYVAYANLVGGQDELVFDGGSVVVTPAGKICSYAKQFAEDLLVVDLPLSGKVVKNKPGARFIVLPSAPVQAAVKPRIAPRKVVIYSRIERIFNALVLGTRDYVRKNGFKKVVIGLSGGIDSALVAVIAKEAVGKENVIGISMPSPFNSSATQSDAKTLAQNLDISFYEIPITNIYQSYLDSLAAPFAGHAFNVAEENIQARVRGNILMAFSNKFGWLVLTTGNKSEVAVGYCTLYGDLSGGFAVIKDLPKTQVYQVARFINEKFTQVIPESIIDRAPSAELRAGQKDQDSLPPYEVLDPLVKAYVEDRKSMLKMKHLSQDMNLIKKVIDLVDHSEYKRRQSPPGIKISLRAFGKDWRLPITNKYKEF